MKTKTIFYGLVVIASILLATWGYHELPPTVASHWNASGAANGYSGKEIVFLFPAILVAFAAITEYVIPKDPLYKNIGKFENEWFVFKTGFAAFFIYLQALFIAYNLGIPFNFSQLLVPALGILFYLIGLMFSKAKRNYFIGIRTPWTLSSDLVWDKTHAIGAKLFKATGIAVFIAGIIIPTQSVWVLLGLVIGTTVYLLYFSWNEWKQTKHRKK
ncbi:hypothetical protein AUJ65_06450 [Candidatus Micrarchaeota archaeon CG1_02_51_15]|nr:MAG: hypothetical protein AUJ65_06450 [Candidatus Micrarchaeota archaeon CG1_02_51_15]